MFYSKVSLTEHMSATNLQILSKLAELLWADTTDTNITRYSNRTATSTAHSYTAISPNIGQQNPNNKSAIQLQKSKHA